MDRTVTVLASGSVEAKETLALPFEIAGRVSRVLVKEGDEVRAGQVLAELDARDYELGLQAAQAQAAAAHAVQAKADAGVRKQELAQAKVQLDRVTDEYTRLKMLFDRGSLAPNDFKKIEAAWLAAKEQYAMAQEGARAEDRAAAREQANQARAGEDLARKRLSETVLRSPVTGVVVRKEINPGEMTAAGRPVFVLMQLHTVYVRCGVPEAEIGRVKPGQRALVEIPSLDGRQFEGRVETVGYAAEPQSRTFPVKALVPNPGLVLRAGMVAEARIETGTRIKALTVPGEAIVRDAQGATLVYVYAPDKKRAYQRRVEAGVLLGREVEIVKGLSGNEQIVVGGQHLLTEGVLAEPGSGR